MGLNKGVQKCSPILIYNPSPLQSDGSATAKAAMIEAADRIAHLATTVVAK